jgi:hypothetical protein
MITCVHIIWNKFSTKHDAITSEILDTLLNSTRIYPCHARNIIVTVRHDWLNESAVSVMQKGFKLIFDGGDSGSKKRRGYGGACGGVWWSLCLAGTHYAEPRRDEPAKITAIILFWIVFQ